MSSRPAEWSEIAKIFHSLAAIFRDGGRTALPPYDTLPSSAVDAECDDWCRQLAADLRDPPLPPESIRPWIMVRAICVSGLAQQLSKQNDKSPGELSRKLIEQLLIHEWHGAFRSRWHQVADDSQAFSC